MKPRTKQPLRAKMKRFFDWLVRGMDAAAERKCAAHEIECLKAEHAAEKKGLIDAHERYLAGLQAQIRNLKTEHEQELIRLGNRPCVKSPEEIACQMETQQIVYHERDMEPIGILIDVALRQRLHDISVSHRVSVRQLLIGMVSLTWPSK